MNQYPDPSTTKNCAPCPEEEARAVFREMARLDNSLDIITATVAGLRHRLNPLLPQLPQETKLDGKSPPKQQHGYSELSSSISGLHEKAEFILSEIAFLNSKIEV